jgi:hypothetical protein
VKRALKRDRSSGCPENALCPGPTRKAPSPASAGFERIIRTGSPTRPVGPRALGPVQSGVRNPYLRAASPNSETQVKGE